MKNKKSKISEPFVWIKWNHWDTPSPIINDADQSAHHIDVYIEKYVIPMTDKEWEYYGPFYWMEEDGEP